jgi:hypothetical protein
MTADFSDLPVILARCLAEAVTESHQPAAHADLATLLETLESAERRILAAALQ